MPSKYVKKGTGPGRKPVDPSGKSQEQIRKERATARRAADPKYARRMELAQLTNEQRVATAAAVEMLAENNGLTTKEACGVVGISPRAFSDWKALLPHEVREVVEKARLELAGDWATIGVQSLEELKLRLQDPEVRRGIKISELNFLAGTAVDKFLALTATVATGGANAGLDGILKDALARGQGITVTQATQIRVDGGGGDVIQ